MKVLYFIRHGATAGNLARRYIGRTDEPLSPKGREQITALQNAGLYADKIFVSPMLRTRQTAELIFPDKEVQLVDDFRETDFGAFEGKTADELSDDSRYQAWLDTLCLGPVPGGEQIADFKRRCCKAFSHCVEELPDGKCGAFVVHGGVIMAILERFARPQRDFYDYHIPNGGILAGYWDSGVITVLDRYGLI